MAEAEAKLSRRMRLTKSSRYHFAIRLEKKAYHSGFALNILSFLALMSGLAGLVFSEKMDPVYGKYYNVAVIGISVIAIIISSLFPISDLSRRSSDAHRCARDISKIYRQFGAGQLALSEASMQYEDTLSNYDWNHDECDYLYSKYDLGECKGKYDEWKCFLGYNLGDFVSIFSPYLVSLLGLLLMSIILRLIPRFLGSG